MNLAAVFSQALIEWNTEGYTSTSKRSGIHHCYEEMIYVQHLLHELLPFTNKFCQMKTEIFPHKDDANGFNEYEHMCI